MPYDLSRLRVLVVDDDSFMRQLMRGVLAGLGVRDIREAFNGEDALEVLNHLPVDIVLIDLAMAPMNGLELTTKVRSSDEDTIRFVPIIMVTAEARQEFVIQARDAGITEFLAKPITVQAVYSRLRLTIEKPRGFVKLDGYFGPDRRRRIDDLINGEDRRIEEAQIIKISRQKKKSPRPDESTDVDGDSDTILDSTPLSEDVVQQQIIQAGAD